MNVVTRFSPSPTGELHLGSGRTALFSFLFARQHGGRFLFRLEDTDRERYVSGSEQRIQEDLRWLGLNWDGEIVVQSKRLDRYAGVAEELLNRQKAYRCFCTTSELEAMRARQMERHEPPKYDRTCLRLTNEDVKARLEEGRPSVIRLRIPEGATTVHDLLRGEVTFRHEDLDDQVLMKSDGFPTYHLANVVDDHDSGVTHVIRGEEWLPSTPKHLLLYGALDWTIPQFAHLPLILNESRSKMSKRKDGEWVWVQTYRKKGYLPEALVNMLALLGWNPKTEQEIFSMEELIQRFDLSQVHLSGAVFSRQRLDYVNGHFIKSLPPKILLEHGKIFLKDAGLLKGDEKDEYLLKVMELERERMTSFSELSGLTHYFFEDEVHHQPKDLVWKKSDPLTTKKNLSALMAFLESIDDSQWTLDRLEQNILTWIKEQGSDNGSILWPMRYALSGEAKSPSPFEIANVLGKERTLLRLQKARSVI